MISDVGWKSSQELREQGQDVVSDTIVQVGEDLVGAYAAGWALAESYVESNLGFDVRVTLVNVGTSESRHYAWTVEYSGEDVGRDPGTVVDDEVGLRDRAQGDGGASVFVAIPETIEQKEQFAAALEGRQRLRSLVRLQGFHQVDGGVRQSVETLARPLLEVGRRTGTRFVGIANGERGAFGVSSGNGTDEVIQDGPDVVDAIPGQEPQAWRDRRCWPNQEELVAAVSLEFIPYAVRTSTQELVGFRVEELTVTPRMLKAKDQLIHWAHHELTLPA
jgi:hypothetical protein